jgi:hypothetical protein
MSTECSVSLLEEDRSWLEKQPGMNHWQEGCAVVLQDLKTWLSEYCQRLGIQPATNASLLRRLWICWRHHWRQAAELAPDATADGREVGQRIRAKEGFARGKQLGGDPLRDVVLAEAVVLRDPVAILQFESEYKDFCLAQSRAVNSHIDEDPDDWWYLLLDHLAGYSQPPGKLTKYLGRCGLKFWLARVARNFAHNNLLVVPPILPESPPPGTSCKVDVDECLELLGGFIRDVLRTMPADDRLIICLLHIDELQGKEVARILGIDAGNVSRRKQKAMIRFREALEAQALAREKASGYGDCMELIFEHRNWQRFAELLWAELKKAGDTNVQGEEV